MEDGLLAVVTIGVALLLQDTAADETSVYIPLTGWDLDLGILFYPFLFLVIAGTVNGANLTDGIDGLAAGTVTIMLLTFLAIAGISWLRSGAPGDRSEIYLDVATLAAALIGGTIGFLWYNAFPAEVFMGDTGSMALGGAIAGFAIVTGTEILLLLIAGIFVIEVLSLIIQVVSFKRTGRRVFLIAPIHHHFEMKAWSGDEGDGPLLDRVRDPLRDRLRALLPRLPPVRPAMSPGHALEGRRVLVVGLARSGLAAAEALVGLGGRGRRIRPRRGARRGKAPRARRRSAPGTRGGDAAPGDRSRREEPGRARGDAARRGRARAAHPRLERDRARRPPAREPPPRRHRHEREDDDERAPRRGVPRGGEARRGRGERRAAR